MAFTLKISFYIFLVGVAILSVIEPKNIPAVETINDKAGHFLAYGFLFGLGYLGKITTNFKLGIGLFAYSFLMELIQYLLPYRTFSLLDMVANGSGILLAFVCLYFWDKHAKTN